VGVFFRLAICGQRGWLRRYYPTGQDELHYDLTSSTELAIDWLLGLNQRNFIGTESRLMTVFDLLHQIVDGTELNSRAHRRTTAA